MLRSTKASNLLMAAVIVVVLLGVGNGVKLLSLELEAVKPSSQHASCFLREIHPSPINGILVYILGIST